CPPENVCPSVPVTALTQVLCVVSKPDTYPWTTVPLQHLLDAPPALQPLPCVGPNGTPSGPYADYDDDDYSHYVPSNPLMGYCTPLVTGSCPGGYLDGTPDPFITPNPPPPRLSWPDVVDPNRWQPLVYNNHKRQTFLGAHWAKVMPFA